MCFIYSTVKGDTSAEDGRLEGGGRSLVSALSPVFLKYHGTHLSMSHQIGLIHDETSDSQMATIIGISPDPTDEVIGKSLGSSKLFYSKSILVVILIYFE